MCLSTSRVSICTANFGDFALGSVAQVVHSKLLQRILMPSCEWLSCELFRTWNAHGFSVNIIVFYIMLAKHFLLERRQLAWIFAIWAKASVMMREAKQTSNRYKRQWSRLAVLKTHNSLITYCLHGRAFIEPCARRWLCMHRCETLCNSKMLHTTQRYSKLISWQDLSPSCLAIACCTAMCDRSEELCVKICVLRSSVEHRPNTAEMNRCPHFEQLFWHISTRTRAHTCTHDIQTCHMCWYALNTHMHWQLNLPRPRQFAQSGIGSRLQLVQLKFSKPTI